MIYVKYLDRGYRDSIALIPGWATDSRIFDNLDMKFNYLIPAGFFSPFTVVEGLLKALEDNKIKKLSLLGYSLGAFAASEFASRYPELVDELILVGARKRYSAEGLEKIKKYLSRSKKGYLYKFYKDCFPDRGAMRWFERNLMRAYQEELRLDYLLRTIDYLKAAQINPENLSCVKRVTIVHGKRDNIAPVNEALAIKDGLTHSRLVLIEGAGHMPFLKEDFDLFLWPPRK